MARPRKPIAVLEAEGKSHMTKKEIEERREQELKVPFTNVKPPSYLNNKQKRKFKDIANKLLALGIMTELDVDCLAMYIISHDIYLSYTETIVKLLDEGDLEMVKDVQTMQDKAFRQAHTAARSLGLTITDRCKIVIPLPPDNDDDEL